MTPRGPFRFPLALAAVLMALFFAQLAKAAPPNIVVFIADDLGANDIGPYGNPVVRTPNLDALAKNALLFNRAFASSPTCSPSRASLYSGMLPFRNGAHANHAGIKQGVRTLPAYLKPLGYKVAIAGKFHVGPMDAFPFELIRDSDVPEPGHVGQGVLWTDLNMEPVDTWIAAASKDDTPFMLVIADHSPHVYWPETADYDSSAVDVPSIHIDTEETRRARAQYYTDISKMDRNVGKLLESLEKNHLTGNTVVIFTADQGPQWPFGKWNLYDYGVQVPLLVRWPGAVTGGAETDALVSLVDMLPTIVEIAGGTAPKQGAEIDGTSLLPLLRGEVNQVRNAVFASHTGDGTMNQAPMRMMRTTRYKYILNLAPEVTYTTHIDKSGVVGYGKNIGRRGENAPLKTRCRPPCYGAITTVPKKSSTTSARTPTKPATLPPTRTTKVNCRSFARAWRIGAASKATKKQESSRSRRTIPQLHLSRRTSLNSGAISSILLAA